MRWLPLIAALVVVPRLAEARDPLRVVVRVGGEEEAALVARVKGQVADLEVVLETDAEGPFEPGLREQLEHADALAARHTAEVIVWFSLADGSVLVCVAVPAQGRVLVRRVTSAAHPTSATLEEVALVVRSTLRALAAGGEIGVTRESLAPSAPPELPRLPPPPVQRRRPLPPRPVPLRLRAFGGVGAEGGADNRALGGVACWLGVTAGAVEGRVVAFFDAPYGIDTPYGTLGITEHTLVAEIDGVFLRARRWELAAGGRAGASLLLRDTWAVTGLVLAAPRSVSPVGRVGLDVQGRMRPTDAHWAVVAAVGLDAVLGAPRFGFATAGGFASFFQPGPLEPWGLVGVEFTMP